MNDMVEAIAKAIATMEGYFISQDDAAKRRISWPTRAQINNNPGNLRAWGKNPTNAGYALFGTAEHGWNALRRQVRLLIDRNLTLLEFFGGKPGVYPGYAPSADKNNPQKYAEFVSKQTSIPIDQPLKEHEKEWLSKRGPVV